MGRCREWEHKISSSNGSEWSSMEYCDLLISIINFNKKVDNKDDFGFQVGQHEYWLLWTRPGVIVCGSNFVYSSYSGFYEDEEKLVKSLVREKVLMMWATKGWRSKLQNLSSMSKRACSSKLKIKRVLLTWNRWEPCGMPTDGSSAVLDKHG